MSNTPLYDELKKKHEEIVKSGRFPQDEPITLQQHANSYPSCSFTREDAEWQRLQREAQRM